MRTIKQTIPQAQKDIIVSALATLKTAATMLEVEGYITFDIEVLMALMKYDISVELTNKEFENFSINNGVDFPEYR